MSKKTLLNTIEITINDILTRLNKLNGDDKLAVNQEYREWIEAINSDNRGYDILYLNHIEK